MIGPNIKKLRLQHGLTQKNLADKLFVSAQAVSRWENDGVEPSISTILELAKIFGVTADEILNPQDATAQKVEEAQGTVDNGTEKTTPKEELAPSKIEIKVQEHPKVEIKAQEPTKHMLALCEACNSPIYNKNEIVRENGKIICTKCHKERECKKQETIIADAKKRRSRSFIFGILASAVGFIITIAIWNHPLANSTTHTVSILLSLAMFTFVSCCVLNNNFVGELFLRVASWSIKAPGLIFTLDIDGCLWFIAMKILIAVLGFLLGVFMFCLALVLGAIASVFVYPYAIVVNYKRPEDTYF